MSYISHNFAEGISRSFLDNTLYSIKQNLSSDSATSSVDLFFRPIVTALLDTIQLQLIQKRCIETFSKGLIVKKVPTLLSNQTFIAFLVAKTALNFTASLARGTIGFKTTQTLRNIHNGMEEILPLVSIIVAVASMNLAYISAYFLHQCISYLGNHNSTSTDMRSICKYSSTILGVSSLLLLKRPSSSIF